MVFASRKMVLASSNNFFDMGQTHWIFKRSFAYEKQCLPGATADASQLVRMHMKSSNQSLV